MLWRRALAAGLVLAALVIWPPSRLADAHALVLESSPRADDVLRAAPARIFLRFNSRIEQGLSGITVTGPGGGPIPLPVSAADRAPNELSAPVPPLPPGQYLVRWKVLSADGHVTVGAFRFSVAPGS